MAAAFKLLKQLDALLFGNTGACIPHADADMVRFAGIAQHADHDTPAGGIAQRVADKVLNDAADPLRVSVNPELGIMHAEFNAALGGNRFKLQLQVAEQVMQRIRLALRLNRAPF